MRAIRIELVQADREQLHHLARIVLVRLTAARVLLEIAAGIEEIAHRCIERERFEQLAEVAEGMRREHIPIGGYQARGIERREGGEGHDEHFRQRERHSLAHLVGTREQLIPDHAVAEFVRAITPFGGDGIVATRVEPRDAGLATRLVVTDIEPRQKPATLERRDLGLVHRKLGLQRETYGFGVGCWNCVARRWRRWAGRGRRRNGSWRNWWRAAGSPRRRAALFTTATGAQTKRHSCR